MHEKRTFYGGKGTFYSGEKPQNPHEQRTFKNYTLLHTTFSETFYGGKRNILLGKKRKTRINSGLRPKLHTSTHQISGTFYGGKGTFYGGKGTFYGGKGTFYGGKRTF